ncbi:MAG TPA: HD-GYP domain-containing protein [Desulfitobacteriaceae bacterium]|jgi:HD-GYP domain-containing protein (c-di-GMP phosphodiesterase class II)|nr:HD-GYP domain-containing protein [Desulfitobacteriaceae bacterium]
MRLVNVGCLETGTVLAKPVINPAGQVLLQAGIILTTVYIERLKRLGFDVVFVQDDRFEDVEVRSAISTTTRELAYRTVHKITQNIVNGKDDFVEVGRVRNVILNMINDLLQNFDVIGNLAEISGYDNYTFHHSVNTTVLSLIIGIGSNYSTDQLLELGMGVLMHDIGKIKVPEKILNKTDPLTKEEFEEIKKHAMYGYEMLRLNQDISLLSAHVALQHQEKYDGSGYPRGLKGKEIHEYARIATISDVYEALTSVRVYRGAMEPYKAYEFITVNSGSHFDPEFVKAFCKNVAVYPNGTGVVLSNGMRGNVVKQNPAYSDRPYVRIIYDKEQPLDSPIDYKLADHPSLLIVKVENK